MLLITPLVGVKQHAGVCFLPSSSTEAVGTRPRLRERAPSIAPPLLVEKHRRALVSVADAQVVRKLFRGCAGIHKMVDFSQAKGAAKATLVRSCPEKCQLGARNEPAVSSYLVLRRMSRGAICSINTPAVINTVLRRPMAWKRLGGGVGGAATRSGEGWSSGCPHSPVSAAILCQS